MSNLSEDSRAKKPLVPAEVLLFLVTLIMLVGALIAAQLS